MKDGKYLEQLVFLIEKSIDTNARIEHDVHMPILNSISGATAQCDIVTWTGSKHRETVTIVEVQDRKGKVKPNDFRGWQQKLEDVGAQHLICVSRQDFPKSIKEKAQNLGNKIFLINILTPKPEKIPFSIFKTNFQYEHFNLTSLNSLELQISESELERNHIGGEKLFNQACDIYEKCFSINRQDLISLYDICYTYAKGMNKSGLYRKEIEFHIDRGTSLFVFRFNKFVKIGLKFNCQFELDIIPIPVNVLSYQQTGEVLAWVLDVSYELPSGKVDLKVTILPDGENFKIIPVKADLPSDINLTMEIMRSNNEL
jgi:hypothetical protein